MCVRMCVLVCMREESASATSLYGTMDAHCMPGYFSADSKLFCACRPVSTLKEGVLMKQMNYLKTISCDSVEQVDRYPCMSVYTSV